MMPVRVGQSPAAAGQGAVPLGWERCDWSTDWWPVANHHEEKLLFGLCHELVSHSPWPEPMPISHVAGVGEVAPTLVPGSARGRQSASLPRAATAG